jgi:hypothetical protein
MDKKFIYFGDKINLIYLKIIKLILSIDNIFIIHHSRTPAISNLS